MNVEDFLIYLKQGISSGPNDTICKTGLDGCSYLEDNYCILFREYLWKKGSDCKRCDSCMEILFI